MLNKQQEEVCKIWLIININKCKLKIFNSVDGEVIFKNIEIENLMDFIYFGWQLTAVGGMKNKVGRRTVMREYDSSIT